MQTPKLNVEEVPVHLIDDPHAPMRSDIDLDGIRELSESIRSLGLINPISVVPRGERFECVAGHRRLLAVRLLGAATIAAVVRELDDAGVVAVMATENLERSDVDPVDEALLIGRAIGEDESKIPELAKSINRSVAWVRDRLDLLGYPDELIAAIRGGRISLGVAKWIGKVTSEKIRDFFIKDAASNGWTVLQAQVQFNLWESGVLDNIENPPPPPADMPLPESARARAMCARCGRLAVHPNLTSVFVHAECPPDEVAEAPAAAPTPSPEV